MKKQYDDFDASLKQADSDLLWNIKQKQSLKKNILADIEELKFHKKNKTTILSLSLKKERLIRKLTCVGVALIIFVSLLIGSASFSPTMAEIIAKIPYINQVFQKEDVQTTIMNKLKSNNYKIDGINTTGKEIEILVSGSEEYFQNVRNEVKNTALEILKSRNYDAYTVTVIKSNHTHAKPSAETLKQIEEASKVDEAVQQELANHNYKNVTIQVGTLNNAGDLFILIEIPNTEKNSEEIEKLARSVIEERTNKKFTLQFEEIDVKTREQENRWLRVLIPIFDGLNSKKEYQVIDYSFSIQSGIMYLYFDTNVLSSNPDSKQLGKKIENAVKEFLESEEAKEIIKDDEFKINVYSKDKQKIN